MTQKVELEFDVLTICFDKFFKVLIQDFFMALILAVSLWLYS